MCLSPCMLRGYRIGRCVPGGRKLAVSCERKRADLAAKETPVFGRDGTGSDWIAPTFYMAEIERSPKASLERDRGTHNSSQGECTLSRLDFIASA
jgi:hypothetical protein